MIRLPTPPEAAYAWHRAALEAYGSMHDPKAVRVARYVAAAAKNPILKISENEPQCGFFRRQMVKGGPFVDARIYLWQVVDPATGELLEPEGLVCEIAEQLRDVDREWTYLAREPIPESEFNFLRDNRRWVQRYAPHEPAAHPERRIDPLTAPLLF